VELKDSVERIKEVLEEMKGNDASGTISDTLVDIENDLCEIKDSLATIALHFEREDNSLVNKISRGMNK